MRGLILFKRIKMKLIKSILNELRKNAEKCEKTDNFFSKGIFKGYLSTAYDAWLDQQSSKICYSFYDKKDK
ncbi:hypothetical protein BM1374166_00421 [Bartonella tribocorum]|nr:hypothetical protein BM1374166_00421 [Bartonella tribocorum]